MSILPPDCDELRYRTNPARFARDILGWNPDPKQAEALGHPGPRVVLNWARQCGKSTVCAAKALHTVATRANSVTLVIGGVEGHLGEFFSKIDSFTNDPTNSWVKGRVKGQPGKRIARTFPNGSRIVGATTNEAVRGHSAQLLIVDEAGFVPDPVWDGVLPTLAATRGGVWVVGTPNGAQGWYHQLWTSAAPSSLDDLDEYAWLKSLYPAAANPRITRAFLQDQRRLRGENYVKQEYECQFIQNGKTLLHAEDIDALFVSDKKALPW